MAKLPCFRTHRLKQRVETIRARPRPEPLNESHARELIARKLVLPAAKRLFRGNLFAVAIIGSAQVGLRKASRARPESDLDIVIVTRRPVRIGAIHRAFFRMVEKQCGVDLNISFQPADIFVINESFASNETNRYRMQIIYGERNINQLAKSISQGKTSFSENDFPTLAQLAKTISQSKNGNFVRQIIEKKELPTKDKHKQ